ncbi:MAG: hypothetical protein HXX81_06390 [Campylobacterales bacterium]|nr:hypothetical protein [Campylobacterales bacterium]
MIDKKELILDSIIKEYLKRFEPIGSEYLKEQLEIKISPSSIRGYFKKLEDVGFLMQVHISSGRIPTAVALKRYWENRLLPLQTLDIGSSVNLKNSSNKTNIYFVAKFKPNNRFLEVINANNKYLVLVFENTEVLIEYSEVLEKALSKFINFSLDDLIEISYQIGAHTLHKKLKSAIKEQRVERSKLDELVNIYTNFNMKQDNFSDAIDGELIDKLQDGIYFNLYADNGYMMIKQNAIIEDEFAKLLIVGTIYRDFEQFFEIIKS